VVAATPRWPPNLPLRRSWPMAIVNERHQRGRVRPSCVRRPSRRWADDRGGHELGRRSASRTSTRVWRAGPSETPEHERHGQRVPRTGGILRGRVGLVRRHRPTRGGARGSRPHEVGGTRPLRGAGEPGHPRPAAQERQPRGPFAPRRGETWLRISSDGPIRARRGSWARARGAQHEGPPSSTGRRGGRATSVGWSSKAGATPEHDEPVVDGVGLHEHGPVWWARRPTQALVDEVGRSARAGSPRGGGWFGPASDASSRRRGRRGDSGDHEGADRSTGFRALGPRPCPGGVTKGGGWLRRGWAWVREAPQGAADLPGRGPRAGRRTGLRWAQRRLG